MTPYRASAEPEPEVLWSTPVAKLGRRRSALLAGSIGATLGGFTLAVAGDAPGLGMAIFALFLAAAATATRRTWLFGGRLEVRIERIGAAHRLRVMSTPLALLAPFSVSGSSRIDDGTRFVMQLEVRGKNGDRLTFGASGDPDNLATRDDWFDGAPLAAEAHEGDLLIDPPARLVELRDALLRL